MKDRSLKPCPLYLSQAQWDAIQQQQAVAIREIETADGERCAYVIGWGSLERCKLLAKASTSLIVPVGEEVIGQQAVLVANLGRPPKGAE